MKAANKNAGLDENAEFAPKKSRLLGVGLFGSAALVLIVGWIFCLAQIRTDRALTLEASSNQLSLEAETLAMQVGAMINDGVGAAMAGANEISVQDTVHRLSEDHMSSILQRMLTGGEYVHSLFVVTPSIYVGASRDHAATVDEGLTWTTQLFSTQTNTSVNVWIGRPLNARHGDLDVLIPIAHRVADFRGEKTWAGALLGVKTLEHTYNTLRIGHTAMSLLRTDNILLARVPVTPGTNFVGKDFSGTTATRIYQNVSRQGVRTMIAPDFLTGKPRQFAVRDLALYPAGAAASRNVDDVLQAWQARTRSTLMVYFIASLIFVAVTITLYVMVQRRIDVIVRSEQRFQLALAGTNDGIWEWDIPADFIYYSTRFRQLLGYVETDEFPPCSATFWTHIHPDDKQRTEIALQRHLIHHEPYDTEFRLRMRGGDYRWFRARGQALWNDKDDAFRMAGSISDIHDRKFAQQSLEMARQAELHAKEEFAQHLLLAQEQERQRLANELHDSVGQNLSLIKNRALMMQQHADLPAGIAKHVTALESLAADVIAEVRTVAQNLRPPHIDQLGLTNAIDSLLERVASTGSIEIKKRIENVDDVICGTNATHMFRIVQEALNNIIKHAHARSASVVLERDVDRVRLHIADDGCGFNVEKMPGHGIGLGSLQERSRMLHAHLDILSRAGAGTQIHIELPIAEITNEADMDDALENESAQHSLLAGLNT